MTETGIRRFRLVDEDGNEYGVKRDGNVPIVSVEGGEDVALVNKDLLEQILDVLKKIEYHLYLGTDTDLNI